MTFHKTCQKCIQNANLDDLVAAIATAAINGALPLHRMNLGNPNRRGDVLRIPILLIRPNDFKRKRPNNNRNAKWNGKSRVDLKLIS